MAGGAYTLNFAAADPSIYIPPIPFPSDLNAPTGRGNGDLLIPLAEFNNGNSDVRVESLAPQDMALGQIVPFETSISVSGDTAPENGTITFAIGWNTLTTNGNDFGYDARPDDVGYGVIGAFIDTSDGTFVDTGDDATVDSFTWSLINDEIVGIFTISGLDDGDRVVLEPWLVLDDTISAGVGGNVQSRLIDATTGSDQTINVANGGAISLVNGDAISTGNQTVPLLKPSNFFNANVDLSVIKTDDVDPIGIGETLTYTITASNAGPSVANNVVIYDQLDPNVTFLSASNGGFINTDSTDSIPDGAVQWDVGALASGDTVEYTLEVRVNEDAPTAGTENLNNTVTVTTISNDTNLANNTATESTDVEGIATSTPVLNLVKTADVTEVNAAGDVINYSYELTNTVEGSEATGITLVDDNFTPDNSDDFEPTFVSGDTDSDGKLDFNETWLYNASYSVTQADIDNGSDLVNTATADSAETDPVTDDATVTVNQPPAFPILNLVKTADVNEVNAAGDVINYSYELTNTVEGSEATGITLVDDNFTPDSGDDFNPTFVSGDTDSDGKLDFNETWLYNASYSVTQADIDNGSDLVNTATANSAETNPVTDNATVTVIQNPEVDIVKDVKLTIDADLSDDISAGDDLTYSFTIENTGNVTLTDVTVQDPLPGLSPIDFGDFDGSLDPGESVTGTATYQVTTDDVEEGEIKNTATVAAEAPGGNPEDPNDDITDTDTETVDLPNPALAINKIVVDTDTDGLDWNDTNGNGLPDTGETIDYSIVVSNIGGANLTGVTVTDLLGGGLALSDLAGDGAEFLATGASETATFSYELTQNDINAGTISNTAIADSEQTDPVEDTINVELPQNPEVDIVKDVKLTIDADLSDDISAGDDLTYSFTIENTGNVTLTDVTVQDPLPGLSPIDFGNFDGSLDPGESVTGTATYQVTADDVEEGEIKNTATVAAEAPGGNPEDPNDDVIDTDTETVELPDPSIDIIKDFVDFIDNDGNGVVTQGDELNYSISVNNTGSANLTEVTVNDSLGGVLTLSDLAGDGESFLAAGASESANFTYVVTEQDAVNGQVLNTATVDSLQSEPASDDAIVEVKFAIDIDIKPGSDPSSFNLRGNGTVPVAIFGTGVFDTTKITEVCLEEFIPGPSSGTGCTSDINYEDVNGDGILDAVAKFSKPSLLGVLDTQSEFAKLTGTTTDGLEFVAIGDVNVTQV